MLERPAHRWSASSLPPRRSMCSRESSTPSNDGDLEQRRPPRLSKSRHHFRGEELEVFEHLRVRREALVQPDEELLEVQRLLKGLEPAADGIGVADELEPFGKAEGR